MIEYSVSVLISNFHLKSFLFFLNVWKRTQSYLSNDVQNIAINVQQKSQLFTPKPPDLSLHFVQLLWLYKGGSIGLKRYFVFTCGNTELPHC